MFLEYPSFSLSVESQGSTSEGWLFLVNVEASDVQNTAMLLIAPKERDEPHRGPPPAAFAAAGQMVILDMKRLLVDGVEKVVDDQMRSERRIRRRDQEEKTEMAEQALAVAQAVDAGDLARAEEDLARELAAPAGGRGKKRRHEMGAAGPSYRTSGARKLASQGFTDIHEVVLQHAGPGLWYEANEPAAKYVPGPREWSPRKKSTDRVLFLRQGMSTWHAFYAFAGTGSGSSPLQALTGGLGDAIDTDAQMKRYCDYILSAPRRLAQEYEGLSAAQGQCYYERQSGREEWREG